MKKPRPDITPELKVGELLEHYPEVEPALIDLSPEDGVFTTWFRQGC